MPPSCARLPPVVVPQASVFAANGGWDDGHDPPHAFGGPIANGGPGASGGAATVVVARAPLFLAADGTQGASVGGGIT